MDCDIRVIVGEFVETHECVGDVQVERCFCEEISLCPINAFSRVISFSRFAAGLFIDDAHLRGQFFHPSRGEQESDVPGGSFAFRDGDSIRTIPAREFSFFP